ncbi:MAG TPA: hypothetical protein VLC91_15255 [Spongiibacteraceae bacterium]|nr:hypothetical protein [Spongiibacteraceae bacterium]
MQTDKEYLRYLLLPFEKAESLSPHEYVAALRLLGIEITEWIYINQKFLMHFEMLIAENKIANLKGTSNLADFGFYVGVDKAVALIESCRIIKCE